MHICFADIAQYIEHVCVLMIEVETDIRKKMHNSKQCSAPDLHSRDQNSKTCICEILIKICCFEKF